MGLYGATQLFIKEPQVLMLLILQAITGYFGLRCYLKIVKRAGAAVGVVTTSCRKLLTIILSFLIFTKPFESMHAVGMGFLALGLSTVVYRKRNKGRKRT